MKSLREYIDLIETVVDEEIVDEVSTEPSYPDWAKNQKIDKLGLQLIEKHGDIFFYKKESIDNIFYAATSRDILRVDEFIQSDEKNLLTKDNGLIAYLILHKDEEGKHKRAFIFNIYVSQEYRGTGIAKKLYNFAILRDHMVLETNNQTLDSQNLWKFFISQPNIYAVWVEKDDKIIAKNNDQNFLKAAYDGTSEVYLCIKKRGSQ